MNRSKTNTKNRLFCTPFQNKTSLNVSVKEISKITKNRLTRSFGPLRIADMKFELGNANQYLRILTKLEFQGPLGPMKFQTRWGALVARFAGMIINRTKNKCRGTQDYAPDHPEHHSQDYPLDHLLDHPKTTCQPYLTNCLHLTTPKNSSWAENNGHTHTRALLIVNLLICAGFEEEYITEIFLNLVQA